MAVLGKAFKASCVDVLLPRELATGQRLLGQLRLRLQLRRWRRPVHMVSSRTSAGVTGATPVVTRAQCGPG